jgi:UTP--glucose-1-phosphate uridylyltransferase
VSRYGIVSLRDGTREIEDIVEKPSIEDAPSNQADFGRMIFTKDVIDILQRTALGKDNELWVVDAIREYVRGGGRFLAKEVEGGRWLTTGDPVNYLRALLIYAMDRDDVKGPLLTIMKELVAAESQ